MLFVICYSGALPTGEFTPALQYITLSYLLHPCPDLIFEMNVKKINPRSGLPIIGFVKIFSVSVITLYVYIVYAMFENTDHSENAQLQQTEASSVGSSISDGNRKSEPLFVPIKDAQNLLPRGEFIDLIIQALLILKRHLNNLS